MAENGAHRVEGQRLTSLVRGLSVDDMRIELAGGKSVAAVLVHLAFWDAYVADLLGQWSRSGFSEANTNFDAVNAAVAMLARELPLEAIGPMVLSAAEDADRAADGLESAVVEPVEAEWAAHRRTHLDQIEQALGR